MVVGGNDEIMASWVVDDRRWFWFVAQFGTAQQFRKKCSTIDASQDSRCTSE